MIPEVGGSSQPTFFHQRNKKNAIIFVIFMLANLFTFLAIVLAKWSLHNNFKSVTASAGSVRSRIFHDPLHGPYITCPEDPVLARQENCHFDLLANGWIPSPCFDSVLYHDFMDGRDYGFFEDIQGKRRVDQEVIMEGDTSTYPEGLFVTFHEHFEHCRYLLNGSSRAIAPPFTGVLDIFRNTPHLQHCIHLLTQSREPGSIETTVKAYFGSHRCYLSII
ncbi:hypothetical protein BKA61DRAFT_597510 [Leptodontidium sp. MPI-SDFR-AT-0119]|nr:hypothetical protein BKA61DRAFT_597510 [Leptodontidium sp. MPI-SDFR-AT-0119]